MCEKIYNINSILMFMTNKYYFCKSMTDKLPGFILQIKHYYLKSHMFIAYFKVRIVKSIEKW